MWKLFKRKRGCRGFTLIELMIVIAIVGILASIAVLQFSAYRTKGFNAAAKSDLRTAYTVAQAFFSDYPAGTVTNSNLVSYGYQNTTQVTVTIINGTMGSLTMTAAHTNGDKTYSVDKVGYITE
ncbi:MAG: type II secretion system protein [Smithellaceae bacterium]|nr:type II secretion system protein [Smithellaceae bacterium]